MGGVESEQRPVLESAIDTFMQLLPEMLKKHEGQWVVIKDGEEKPLGFSKSLMRIYKKGVREYENVPFLLRQVSRDYLEFGRYGRPISVYSESASLT
jgi:hypothetical protein